MRRLSPNPTIPQTFILAQDGAFSTFQPENDHVWMLDLEGTEAHPISLQTTYNLRAASMRLFPNIIIENQRRAALQSFHCKPTLTDYAPDSVRITCQPIPTLSIQFTFFIPQSDILVGEAVIRNEGAEPLNLTLNIAALLSPLGAGMPTRPVRKENHHIIAGRTGDLCPVLFMAGGAAAVSNPYPALSRSVRLKPDQVETLIWALAAKSNQDASFDAARKVIASEWKKSALSHIMKHASQTVHIHTGQPDWDAAFRLSQTIAMTHLASDGQGSAFFLRTRLPDQPPYLPSERNALDDLTTLEAAHLTQVLPPSHTSILKSAVERFIERCDDSGFLPSKRNASDLIAPFRECPLLAQLAWEIHQFDGDKDFLVKIVRRLVRITEAWFSQADDTKNHTSPAWQDPDQLQLSTGLFAFDIWEKPGRGLDIRCAESPALLSMLHQEYTAIEKMAEILHETDIKAHCDKQRTVLEERLERTWQDKWNRFVYLDNQSRLCHKGESLYEGGIQKKLWLDKSLEEPQRLVLHLNAADERTRVCFLDISGKDHKGRTIKESFKPLDIRWVLNAAHITTGNRYSVVKTLAIKGMKAEDQLRIETADYSQGDITCLLPICSGIARKQESDAMVRAYLDPELPQNAFGIPETWQEERALPESLPIHVNVLWNTLIIRGLLRAGYVDESAGLFSKLMSTIAAGLRDFHGFFPYYDGSTGQPSGKRNAIAGLPPLRLFLDIAGIRLFSPARVAIWGCSPFPSPIEIQWQGLSLRREGAHVQITFPDNTVFETDSIEPVMITPKG